MSKLTFKAVYASSEETGYEKEELNVHSPTTKGWQTIKFPNYPQELGLELHDGVRSLSQIQLLSHQSKIATRIEVFLGDGEDYQNASFKRLGYMMLDSNERSQFQARELKTVFVDNEVGRYVRFIIHRNHPNTQNLYNQVGIVAINVVGSDVLISAEAEAKTSGLQEIKQTANGIGYKKERSSSLQQELSLDARTAEQLRALHSAKAAAIDAEDFELAKRLKTLEIELKSAGVRLSQLDASKRDAILAEDFDAAKELKDTALELRNEMIQKLHALGIYVPQLPSNAAAKAKQGERNAAEAKLRPPIEAPKESPPSPMQSAPEVISQQPQLADRAVEQFAAGGGQSIVEENTLWGRSPRFDDYSQPVQGSPRHPLDGVPHFQDLPDPEELVEDARETAEQGGVVSLFGDYLARCLFSKVWALREAALSKMRLLFPELIAQGEEIEAALPILATVIRVSVEDKMHQVLLGGVTLLREVLEIAEREKTHRSLVSSMMDPVISVLIERMADGNARIRECAREGIEILAASRSVGPAAVGAHAQRAIPTKLKAAWRPIVSRLQLLTYLTSNYGFGAQGGISCESVMNFARTTGSFSHSNGEVRDAARDLTVEVFRIVGETPLDVYLKLLRPKQLEEYLAAFEKAAKSGKAEKKSLIPLSPRLKHVVHSPTGKVTTSAARVEDKSGSGVLVSENGPQEDFTVCMFCGTSNPAWNEDALDRHYWKECALLSPCPACAQVVEIAGLPDHLLEECEHKGSFIRCDKTGLAIRSNALQGWKRGDKYRSPPDGSIVCPLCYAVVLDTDEAWKKHLFYGCEANLRTKAN